MVRILEALEFRVDKETSGEGNKEDLRVSVSPCLRVTVPSHRQDVTIPADLVEEIGRIYGYDRLTPTLLEDELPPQRRNVALEGEEKVRDVAGRRGPGRGHHLLDDRRAGRGEARWARLAWAPGGNPALARDRAQPAHGRPRPPAPDAAAQPAEHGARQPALRRPGRDLRGRPRLHPAARTKFCPPSRAGWPRCWSDRGRRPPGWGTMRRRWASSISRAWSRRWSPGCGWPTSSGSAAQHPALHPGRTARLVAGGKEIGLVGELHPQVRAAFDLPEQPVALLELDLDALLAGWADAHEMADLSSQPPIYEDLALLVDDAVPAAQVADLIRQIGRQAADRCPAVRRLPRRPGAGGQEVAGLRAHLPGARPHADRRGHEEAARQDRGAAGAGAGGEFARVEAGLVNW